VSNSFPDKIDTLWLDCHLVTLENAEEYGTIENGAMIVNQGQITWLGPADQLPSDIEQRSTQVHRLDGAWVTPGLIDCHTHLVYAGNRVAEYEMRLNGASYEEVARAGGGIVSTVKAVRAASEQELFEQSLPRLKEMLAHGVTTVEIKSGYGLDVPNELKMLKVIRRLGEAFPVTVVPTFLGAHAIPVEYKGKADEYIDLVVKEMLPAAENLAESVDAFCESIGFSVDQTEKVFIAAKKHGLAVKLHAEQLSDLKGAVLATKYDALSVDHLEYLAPDDAKVLADKNCVAVLLPGAFYFLKETQLPPIDSLREAGVSMAISTDCNPGSSPSLSLPLMMNMACTLFGMTPLEALQGVTINAAQALGLKENTGSLETGKLADFVVWDIDSVAELSYRIGGNPCLKVVKNGEIVHTADRR
jgi:imidazolonepropionase